MKRQSWSWPLWAVLLVGLASCQPPAEQAEEPAAEPPVQVSPDSDQRAIEIAQAVLEKMGGYQSWQNARSMSSGSGSSVSQGMSVADDHWRCTASS